ncbi:uncharacterized protein LOC134439898 [Engraulis encrasicolus]|uniref:uncharacterized protein LOC134439898 n=1 Tax=Engraulis encrasicolus TaxID=184585 RepID=UPI002FD4F24B
MCDVDLCHQTDFKSADIFSTAPEVLEGGVLQLRCAIFQTTDNHRRELHMYLCKDGVGNRMDIVKGEKETVFKVEGVEENTGNYSCVYSIPKHPLPEVNCTSEKSVFILVKGTETDAPTTTPENSTLTDVPATTGGSSGYLYLIAVFLCAALLSAALSILWKYKCQQIRGSETQGTRGTVAAHKKTRFSVRSLKKKREEQPVYQNVTASANTDDEHTQPTPAAALYQNMRIDN